jgi:hypothetical protein
MSQHKDTGTVTMIASGAIAQFAHVTYANTGKVAQGGLADYPIGFAQNQAFADGDEVAVKLFTASGTTRAIAAGDFAVDDVLYGAANGRVDNDGGVNDTAVAVGIALSLAGAAGDIVEIVPIAPPLPEAT